MRKNIYFFIQCMIITILVSCAPLEQNKQKYINWRPLAAGKIEAQQKGMPILVDFYFGAGCHRCMALDNEVYNNSQIVELINRDFVPVRIDLSRELTKEEKMLEDDFATGGECLLGFLDPQGRMIKNQLGKNLCTMGMISRGEFMTYLQNAKKRIGLSN